MNLSIKELYAGSDFSTVGLGVSVTKQISRRWDFRFNGSYFGYSYDVHKLDKDLQGNARLNVGAIGGNIDFYLLRFLFLSGGMSYNLTTIHVHALDANSVTIGIYSTVNLNFNFTRSADLPGSTYSVKAELINMADQSDIQDILISISI